MALFSLTVSTTARTTSHYIAFGVTAALMIIVDSFVAYCARNRDPPHWKKYGPLYLCLIATPMILADLLRHVLQDTKVWKAEDGSAMYRDGCNDESLRCLSTTGWLFTFAFTYIGFALLFTGTFWNAHIVDQLKKIRQRWRELRGSA